MLQLDVLELWLVFVVWNSTEKVAGCALSFFDARAGGDYVKLAFAVDMKAAKRRLEACLPGGSLGQSPPGQDFAVFDYNVLQADRHRFAWEILIANEIVLVRLLCIKQVCGARFVDV